MTTESAATAALTLTGRYYRLYPNFETPLGYATETLELPLDRTALLLVDVYGAGYDDEDDGSLTGVYKPDPVIRTMIRERIRPAKDAARRIGIPTVYTTNHLSPGLDEGNEWRNMSMRTCDVDALQAWREPTPILEHSKVIAPDDQDVVVRKQMYSGFFETNLDSVLRNRGVRNLVVVGFDSRICLGNTVTEALYRNYRVIVLRDCVRTFEFPETREGEWANFIAIRHIETNIGYTSTAEEFIQACDRIGSQ
ncbi:isochorismatase family cysteine hydrolase [Dactylosporangium sp. CA-233914]|uniref:isochorismatase family cysteine hydrolase n=1 Tax=Dactylosporangium sp. CA-233914 TaxID=3239934 RepID=UPI003D940147